MSASAYLAGGDLQLSHLLDVDITRRRGDFGGKEDHVAAGGYRAFLEVGAWSLASISSLSYQPDLKGISWGPISI